jgi:hypothetical protein
MSPYLIFGVLVVLFMLAAPAYSLFHTKKKPYKVNARGIPRPRIMPTVAAVWLMLVGLWTGVLVYAATEENGGMSLGAAAQLRWVIPAIIVVVVWWAVRRSPERFPAPVVWIAFFGNSREDILAKRGWNFAPRTSVLSPQPRSGGGFVPPQPIHRYPPAA